MYLQVTGPAAQLLSTLPQPHSLLAAYHKVSHGNIGSAAAAPLPALRSAAVATGGCLRSIGGAGRALLQGLKPKPKWERAGPGSNAAGAASGWASNLNAKIAAMPGGGGRAEIAGAHVNHLQRSPGLAAPPAARLSAATAASGSPSAGSGMGGDAAAIAQLQRQVAALHDEVAALRHSLLGLSGGPAAKEVRE